MRILCFLWCAVVPQCFAETGGSNVRIEYDEHTAPNGVIFESLVSIYAEDPDRATVGLGGRMDLAERVDRLWSQLNTVQLANGAWSWPEKATYSKAQAKELITHFTAVRFQAKARVHDIWRALACSATRSSPSGDDVYLVMEVIEDATEVLWEQLRQEAVRQHGDVIAKLTDKHRNAMDMTLIRSDKKKMWAHHGDPDHLMADLCASKQRSRSLEMAK